MKPKIKNHEEAVALQTPTGSISYTAEVIQDVVKSLVSEIPGVCETKMLPFIPGQSSQVNLTPGENQDAITINLSVCLHGGQNLRSVSEAIQSRVHHDLPKQLGISVDAVNVRIDAIKYPDNY